MSYEQLIEHNEQLIENMTAELKSDQDEGKRDQEHQDLYWFTLLMGYIHCTLQHITHYTPQQL